MENRKLNIFAFLMMMVMCVVSIYIGISKSNSGTDGLSAYEIACRYGFKGTEQEWLNSLKQGEKGDSAYEVAVSNGYSGTEGEWLLSLNGTNGTNSLATVSAHDIYEAYLDVSNLTELEYSYSDFLTYYYSVVGSYSIKDATQFAYSSTVDICYDYTFTAVSLTSGSYNNNACYRVEEVQKGGVAAGAGVIYQMIDTDEDGKLDTAYIITNYHVAFIENYCNDTEHYDIYQVSSGFSSNIVIGDKYDRTKIQTVNYYGNDVDIIYNSDMQDVHVYSVSDIIQTHFLNGENGNYYGVYLYGYQTENYKLNATFVGGSADNDIAVLKIDRNNLSANLATIFFDSNNYCAAEIGDSNEIVGGEDVIAVGNPLIAETAGVSTLAGYKQAYLDALCLSSTNGIVSVVSNDCLFESVIDSSVAVNMRLIRVSAAINSGNSGGGLYNLHGKLIGIVNSKIASSSYDNIGYAIPSNIAISIAKQVIKQCDGVSATSDNTRIKTLKTNNLGFSIDNGESSSRVVTNSTGKKEWFISYNVLVTNVVETSEAYSAGIRTNDIITKVKFNGQTYTANEYFNKNYELSDLLLKVDTTCDSIEITIQRIEDDNLVEHQYVIVLNATNFVEIA